MFHGATPTTPHIDVHRGGDRLRTRISWLNSKHSFSFGEHYDPDNTHHGLLLVSNDDIVLPGKGFDTHPHRDMEIVTWVLEGSLVHQDSIGNAGVIYPGLAQRMSAGRGILHAERNDSWRVDGKVHNDPVRFIQMWVVPDESGIEPSYEQREIDDELAGGRLTVLASGLPQHTDRAIGIRNHAAALHVARLRPGHPVTLPEAPYLHLFVARGDVEAEGIGRLYEGDAVRMTNTGGQRISAVDLADDGAPTAEILVWEMHSKLGAQ